MYVVQAEDGDAATWSADKLIQTVTKGARNDSWDFTQYDCKLLQSKIAEVDAAIAQRLAKCSTDSNVDVGIVFVLQVSDVLSSTWA